MPKFLQCHRQPGAPSQRSPTSAIDNPAIVNIFQKFYENGPCIQTISFLLTMILVQPRVHKIWWYLIYTRNKKTFSNRAPNFLDLQAGGRVPLQIKFSKNVLAKPCWSQQNIYGQTCLKTHFYEKNSPSKFPIKFYIQPTFLKRFTAIPFYKYSKNSS